MRLASAGAIAVSISGQRGVHRDSVSVLPSVKGVIIRLGSRQGIEGISIMSGHPELPGQGHITKGGLYHVQE